MAYIFALAPVPIGHSCIDDYGATGSVNHLFHFLTSFFSAYRQMQSLPSNCRLSRIIRTKSKVMGGRVNVK
ncbi:hypothetical protein QU516_08910 [Moellerella wisconsensis]|uniref:Uncharacterized protein n=2 Tax=Moellerella wisconsensis TaxID=158849 RepID=A0A9Q8Q052_9GAMM|nr:hypothetical protein [Moellerella wisconsensis]UNH23074.1 hypothetical protein MNY68_09410 [Moellerella wisconsensis]UNH26192.1 hypothetical protein MNY64_09865 [Moellerella wisconsensis]UNH29611.1 hypothetical protein MNY72_09450 [Moellerella wisconsensis]UNH37750.1 hypothetical protein MNY70_09465 [Moellerella wisconsensis]UNH41300.1 hypothetical protein MNY66_09475 [Moellerella wisconsensis]